MSCQAALGGGPNLAHPVPDAALGAAGCLSRPPLELTYGKEGQNRLQPRDKRRVAGGGVFGFLGQSDQGEGLKPCGNALEPQRGHMPFAIARGISQQRDLARNALHESAAQFGKKTQIVASGGGKGSVKGTGFI